MLHNMEKSAIDFDRGPASDHHLVMNFAMFVEVNFCLELLFLHRRVPRTPFLHTRVSTDIRDTIL